MFIWDKECVRALANLKSYLNNLPLISIPLPYKQIFGYISSSVKAVSAALIKEDEGVQKLVYYVSKRLIGTEWNYLQIKKLVLAIIIASRRIRHYFDTHPNKVLTSTPIKANWRICCQESDDGSLH